VGKTVKYVFSWLNLVDVVSILPFYVALGFDHSDVSKDLAIIRVLRLLRVMRVVKLGKYSDGGVIIGRTIRASLPALVLFIFLTAVLTTVFGSIMYFFEGGMFQVTQEFPSGGFLRPNARGTAKELTPFTSILMGMYWVVVNTTTLGNAALFPTTVMGRVSSCFVAYIGILALAFPISIVYVRPSVRPCLVPFSPRMAGSSYMHAAGHSPRFHNTTPTLHRRTHAQGQELHGAVQHGLRQEGRAVRHGPARHGGRQPRQHDLPPAPGRGGGRGADHVGDAGDGQAAGPVSYTHLRAHET